MRQKARLLYWGLTLFVTGIIMAYIQSSILAYPNPNTTSLQFLLEIFWFLVGLVFAIAGLFNINQSLEP